MSRSSSAFTWSAGSRGISCGFSVRHGKAWIRMCVCIYIYIYIYIYPIDQNKLFFDLARILTNSQNSD